MGMKFTLAKKIEIGKIIYERKLSVGQASIKYNIPREMAEEFLRIYQETNNLEPLLDLKANTSFKETLNYDQFHMKSFMENYFNTPLDDNQSVFDYEDHDSLFSKVLLEKLINISIKSIDSFNNAYEKGILKSTFSEEELLECSLVYDFLNCKLRLLNTIYEVDGHYIIDVVNKARYQDWNIGVLSFSKKIEQKFYDLDICLLSDIILKEKQLDLQNDLYFQLRKRMIIYFYQVEKFLEKSFGNKKDDSENTDKASNSNENKALIVEKSSNNQEAVAEYENNNDKSQNHFLRAENCTFDNASELKDINVHKDFCTEQIIAIDEKSTNVLCESDDDNNIFLKDLNFSTRVLHVFRRYNINTLSDLKKLTSEDVSKMRNIGKKSLEEIKLFLSNTGEPKKWSDDYELKNNKIYSKSKNIYINDTGIENLLLSVRSTHYLLKNDIFSVSDLIKLTNEDFNNIKNLGKKSIKEIKESTLKYLQSSESGIKLNNEIDVLTSNLSRFKERNNDFEIKNNKIFCKSKNVYIKDMRIENLLLSTRSSLFLIKNNILKISDLIKLTNEDFDNAEKLGTRSIKEIKESTLKYLQSSENEIGLGNQIEAIIKEFKFDGCNKDYVYEKLDNFFEREQIENKLASLIDDKIIFEYESKLFFKYKTFPQFLYKLEKSEDKDIMFRRINGETLEDISKSYNVTRERIRQKQSKFIKKNLGDIDNPIQIFREDKYRYIYENYKLSRKEFCEIFHEKERTYNYLNMRYQNGEKEISEASEDALIPNRLRGLLGTYGLKDFIFLDGQYVKKERRTLLMHYLKISAQTFKINDLVEKFNNFIKEMKLEKPEKLIINSRYMEGSILSNKCILLKYPSSVRYYDFYNYDFSELLDEIDLDSLNNIQVSSLKFFNKYPALMEKYNINDEYELHNILKKIYEEKSNDKIIFKRMPIIQIGDFDRNKYIVETWKLNGYVSQAKLSRIIAEEICIDEMVANSIWVTNSDVPEMSKSISNTPFEDDEIKFLSNALIKEFYWIEEIKKISEGFSEDLKRKIDAVNMKKVGYNLYNLYAIREPLTSTKYFQRILLDNDTFYYPDFSKYKILSLFTNIYMDLRNELEIIEFERDRYIKSSKLSEFGYGKDKIKEIGNDIKNIAKNYKYFTIFSLRKDGINFEIDELGFSDTIIESIIKYATDLKYIRVLNTYIFSTNMFSFLDLIKDELRETGKIETDDLIHSLKEKYNIVVTKEYIKAHTCDSIIYYDSIMDSLYENYKKYLEDICL